VASGHLVPDLQLSLDGDVDLHHLDDARRELVALGQTIDLVAKMFFANLDDLLELLDLLCNGVRALNGELGPVLARDRFERLFVEGRALLEEDLALVVDQLARRRYANELLSDLPIEGVP
jgi:DNA-binding SARP family transcriptional activator